MKVKMKKEVLIISHLTKDIRHSMFDISEIVSFSRCQFHSEMNNQSCKFSLNIIYRLKTDVWRTKD